MNIVVLRGTLSRPPEARTLPSGDRVVQFEVTTRDEGTPARSVPVAWFDAPDRVVELPAGTEVAVHGAIRRRFFRTPAGTGSRTEVVASAVVPTRQRATVRRLVVGALAELEAEAEVAGAVR